MYLTHIRSAIAFCVSTGQDVQTVFLQFLSNGGESLSTLRRKEPDTIKAKVKGQVVFPGDPNYDDVRKIWNAMIVPRPAVI